MGCRRTEGHNGMGGGCRLEVGESVGTYLVSFICVDILTLWCWRRELSRMILSHGIGVQGASLHYSA